MWVDRMFRLRLTASLIFFCLMVFTGCNPFSSTGSLVLSSSQCLEDSASPNSQTCSAAANRFVTATHGSNITQWTNELSSHTLTGSIPTAFYKDNFILFTSPELTPANIKAGVTLFNVTGSYVVIPSSSPTLASNMIRDSSTPQISQFEESLVQKGTDYPNQNPGYRAIPRISKDFDNAPSQIGSIDRSSWDYSCNASQGATKGTGPFDTVCKCGLSGSLENRIADCAAHSVIGPMATWNGATKGNFGQGLWKLVTRTDQMSNTSLAREVWRDERTLLLWSSMVSRNLNWCKASGSNQITGNPTAEDDPGNYCDRSADNTGYQAKFGKAISACFEDGGIHFTDKDSQIDRAGKSELGLNSNPIVHWRMPTLFDYQQAEIDGLRFILPDLGSVFLTTLESSNPEFAYTIYEPTGLISFSPRNSPLGVRCVGR